MQIKKEDASKLKEIAKRYEEQDKIAKLKESKLNKLKRKLKEEYSDSEIAAMTEYKVLLNKAVVERRKANTIKTELIKFKGELIKKYYMFAK